MTSGLRLHGVTAGYGGTDVLRDVDIAVPRGCVVALLGPNGAGKTTLLRTASGLVKPRRGRLTVDGRDVTGRTPNGLAEVGVCHIPEGRAVFPNLTVAENLRLMAAGSVKDATDFAADAFPILGRRMGQKAGTMSGGEQQMLALSRAYVANPTYVLLDEVSMGLAPLVVDEIFGFLRVLRERGTALLVVEQFVAKALELADVVCIMQKGRITFVGEPSQLNSESLAESYLGVGSTQTPTVIAH